jgi:hypothetical protein
MEKKKAELLAARQKEELEQQRLAEDQDTLDWQEGEGSKTESQQSDSESMKDQEAHHSEETRKNYVEQMNSKFGSQLEKEIDSRQNKDIKNRRNDDKKYLDNDKLYDLKHISEKDKSKSK